MDRHKEALMRAQMQRFAGAVNSGKASMLDRFGSPILKGNLIIWRPPFDLIFKVVSVVPILDPRMPAGMVRLTVESTVPLDGMVNQPYMQAVIVGQSSDDDKHSEITGANKGEDEPSLLVDPSAPVPATGPLVGLDGGKITEVPIDGLSPAETDEIVGGTDDKPGGDDDGGGTVQ